MLALTSPTSGARSVGIVRLRTTATEFSFFIIYSVSNNLSNPYMRSKAKATEAESLRSNYLLRYSRNSQNVMEPEGSLPCSQEPTPCPSPESDSCNFLSDPALGNWGTN
jgi:hypothetical protein